MGEKQDPGPESLKAFLTLHCEIAEGTAREYAMRLAQAGIDTVDKLTNVSQEDLQACSLLRGHCLKIILARNKLHNNLVCPPEPSLLPDYQCAICMEFLSSPRTARCGHTFCSFCVEVWLEDHRDNPSCPLCRQPLCAPLDGELPPLDYALHSRLEREEHGRYELALERTRQLRALREELDMEYALTRHPPNAVLVRMVKSAQSDAACISRDVELSLLRHPRSEFCPPSTRWTSSCDTTPLRIDGLEFNMSSPLLQAFSLEQLHLVPGDRVLDIGTGTGIVAALCSDFVGRTGLVHGVDLREGIVQYAKRNIAIQQAWGVSQARTREVAKEIHPTANWVFSGHTLRGVARSALPSPVTPCQPFRLRFLRVSSDTVHALTSVAGRDTGHNPRICWAVGKVKGANQVTLREVSILSEDPHNVYAFNLIAHPALRTLDHRDQPTESNTTSIDDFFRYDITLQAACGDVEDRFQGLVYYRDRSDPVASITLASWRPCPSSSVFPANNLDVVKIYRANGLHFWAHPMSTVVQKFGGYTKIYVGAEAGSPQDLSSLCRILAPEGRMIVPYHGRLVVVRKSPAGITMEETLQVNFGPIVGPTEVPTVWSEPSVSSESEESFEEEPLEVPEGFASFLRDDDDPMTYVTRCCLTVVARMSEVVPDRAVMSVYGAVPELLDGRCRVFHSMHNVEHSCKEVWWLGGLAKVVQCRCGKAIGLYFAEDPLTERGVESVRGKYFVPESYLLASPSLQPRGEDVRCCRCRQYLCSSHQLLSSSHTWRCGGAMVPACVVNHVDPTAIKLDTPEAVRLCQGEMVVSSIKCGRCFNELGWKFVALCSPVDVEKLEWYVGRYGLIFSCVEGLEAPQTNHFTLRQLMELLVAVNHSGGGGAPRQRLGASTATVAQQHLPLLALSSYFSAPEDESGDETNSNGTEDQ